MATDSEPASSVVHRRSAIESFGCPYRYQAIHINGVDDVGEESIRGRAYHAAAWVYILRLAAAGVASDHEEAALAFREGLSITGIPDNLIYQVQRLFFRWAEHFELDLEAFLAAEEIEQQNGRVFRPDLVYCRPGEVELVDFKTYYKGLTEKQAEQELQLRWYLVQAVKAWPGFASYRFTFDFVRLGSKVSLAFTPEQIEGFEPGVQAAIDAVEKAKETGEYPALPGPHCGLCRLRCPVVDNPYRMPIRINGTAQRNEVAEQILATEPKLRQLKKVLKKNCELEGGFVHAGHIFAFWPEVERTYPADEVLTFLKERGIDVSGIRLSASALGAIAGRHGSQAVHDKLEAVKIEKQGWTFRSKKVGEDIPTGMKDLLTDSEDDNDEA